MDIANIEYEKRKKMLLLGPKIVVIGGGTGSSLLLRGIKNYTSNITAIITVADDGGSSGDLRKDLGMLPPGDIRACLLALANTEPTMEKLFNHRFVEGKLKNQNMGNLLIAALSEIFGSFEQAIKEASNVLAITGQVLPVTLEDVQINAILSNGDIVSGESKIPIKCLETKSKIREVFLEPDTSLPHPDVRRAIDEADLIILGPGSLYTSIIPNLLTNNIVEELYKSRAPKIYISNLMTQPGETDGYDVIEHVEAILSHSREDLLDYALINIGNIPDRNLDIYRDDGAKEVVFRQDDMKYFKDRGIEVLLKDISKVEDGYIKHDSDKIGRFLIEFAERYWNDKGAKKDASIEN